MPPYSPARRAGGLVAISGQVGETDGKLVSGGFDAELRQLLANLDALLNKLGLQRGDVVKTNVYLADIGDWARLNAPYVEFFGDPLPARTALAVAALPLGARVEIEAWALNRSSHA
jgi:2-iminobutanoate/2-iminopropanoate deaminase